MFYTALYTKDKPQSTLQIIPLLNGTSSQRQPLQCGSSSNSVPDDSYLTGIHLTPGWREAIEAQHLVHLAQGQNVMSQAGVESAILSSQVQHLDLHLLQHCLLGQLPKSLSLRMKYDGLTGFDGTKN